MNRSALHEAPRGRALLPTTMNNAYPHPIIAREGWTFLALSVVAALVLSFAGWWVFAALAWLVVLFIAQFFRDPPRTVPSDPQAVL